MIILQQLKMKNKKSKNNYKMKNKRLQIFNQTQKNYKFNIMKLLNKSNKFNNN